MPVWGSDPKIKIMPSSPNLEGKSQDLIFERHGLNNGEVRMGYSIYEKTLRRSLPPTVSITAAGRISLNAGLSRMFRTNAVESVLLLYSIEERRIALQPIAKKDKRSYSIAYGPEPLCQASVSARIFLREIGWDGRWHKLPAQWNEKESLLECTIPGWKDNKVPEPLPTKRRKAG